MTEDVIKGDVGRDGVEKVDVVKGGATKGDAAKGAAAKGDAVKADAVKADAVQGDLTLPAPREGAADDPGEPLLVVEGLVKHFPVKGGFPIRRTVGAVQAVDGIDLTVNVGESFGLVGESGCGKSTTGRLITRLLEPTSGRITYRGQDISHASRKQLAPIRSEIQMIFQDPYSSLNPGRPSARSSRVRWRSTGSGRAAAGRSGSVSCWRSSVSTPSTTTASRTSSPAASASASVWPGRWPWSRS
uniref:ABC transporter domain-containing protein n=1 Tax=Streptomyces avermitilis TaxID=33903 RepID=A0A499VBR3_STRAX|nr:hypothetical protein SAVMC3_36610 [Streptomyces avermitilis]